MRNLGILTAILVALATPVRAHEFVDYFDYGRTELSPAGYRMIRSVFHYAQGTTPRRIVISGHMDTMEDIEFSDELSRRRAQSVASELVVLGIDPSVIVIEGRGASTLARPTPPNAEERLNRRVVVTMTVADSRDRP
ncbi:OmpA family protein [Brevundimonas sp.]|uniref:OmpA family protein n=1 Tax=Brevundimonas sp. TaxID=1871086 RepID=UPI0035AD9CC6